MRPTPGSIIRQFVATHEGGYQADPVDRGNIIHNSDGSIHKGAGAAGRIAASGRPGAFVVGTMRGVTPGTYAEAMRIAPADVTVAMMKAISENKAVEIGLELFYRRNTLDRLPWGPVAALVLDFCWGVGNVTGIKWFQRRIGVSADGDIGAKTLIAYDRWMDRMQTAARAVEQIYQWKVASYHQDVARNPAQKKWLQGWINRARSMRADGKWWAQWQEDTEIATSEHADDDYEVSVTGNMRRVDPDTSPVIKNAKRGVMVSILGAISGAGIFVGDIFRDIFQIIPPWALGTVVVLGAAVTVLYFTGIIGRRREEHRDWKH